MRVGVGVALAALVAFAPACHPKAKAKAPAAETDDNANAFSELEKNDREEKAAAAAEKPKGPVYAAPFTAEQIRKATKEGRTYRFKVEMPDKGASEYAVTFRNVDRDGAEIAMGGDKSKRLSWRALEQQSEFPKDQVATRADKIKIPAGKFDCVVYEVKAEDGEVRTYFFAKKLPGAPVFFFVERDGERLRTTTLVDYLPGG